MEVHVRQKHSSVAGCATRLGDFMQIFIQLLYWNTAKRRNKIRQKPYISSFVLGWRQLLKTKNVASRRNGVHQQVQGVFDKIFMPNLSK